MSFLIIAHLFKLANMIRLVAPHLFQYGNIVCLFLPDSLKTLDVLISSLDLILEHSNVLLETLVDFALSLHFCLNRAQVFQLYQVRSQTFGLVLLGNLSGSRGRLAAPLLVGGRLLHFLLLHSVL